MNTLINITCFTLVLVLLHSLSRRHAARTCNQVNNLLPVDAWVIYVVLFFSGLVVSFHIVATAALITGFNFVHIASVTVVLALLWAADRWLFDSPPPPAALLAELKRSYRSIRSIDRRVQWSALVAAGIALLFLLEAITRPPAGWDGLVYHLPLAIKWLQQGSLAFIEESWKFQMPSNGNLFPLFLMSVGSERLLSLVSLPFTLLAMLAIYSMARQLSASREEAILAVLGFATMPIVLYHTFSVMVDIFASAFFLSSLCLLLVLFQQQKQRDEKRLSLAMIAGLAFGLGLGARYIYVPLLFVMTGLCALAVMHSTASLQPGKWKQVAGTTAVFAIGSLISSLFWYVRNVMATGNPMHPLQFSIGENGIQVSARALKEAARDTMSYDLGSHSCMVAGDRNILHWLVSPWEDCWIAGADHYSTNWGLGTVFTTFIPVLIFAALLLAIVTTARRRQIQPLHLLLLLVVVFLAYWWSNLFNMLRSIFPVIGICFVLAAVVIGVFSYRSKKMVYLLFLLAMIANAVLLAAKPLQALSSRLYHKTWTHEGYYNIPLAIDQLPAGSVILNASDERRNYPLYGKNWQNQVVTDRTLLEPITINVIDNNFIEQWNIDYIYIGTQQKRTLADNVKYETLYEHTRDDDNPDNKEILYRVLR